MGDIIARGNAGGLKQKDSGAVAGISAGVQYQLYLSAQDGAVLVEGRSQLDEGRVPHPDGGQVLLPAMGQFHRASGLQSQQRDNGVQREKLASAAKVCAYTSLNDPDIRGRVV